jgi:hypothetical protein
MILHTLNYTTLDLSSQSLDLDNFKIIGKFKVIGNSSNISGHPVEGFSIPFLFENYDSFQIIHYPERYYFRIKDNANNWLPWQRHKHKIADIDGLQSILDSLNNRASSLESRTSSLESRVLALENDVLRLPPGVILAVAWNFSLYSGRYRVLPLYGDSIPVSSYPGLVNNTYVGDSYNHIANFFYKFNSWDGQRSTSGNLFKLPDTRALVPKGRFSGNAGGYFGTRYKYNSDIVGNVVEDALEDHQHWRVGTSVQEETTAYPFTYFYGHNPATNNYFPIIIFITGYMYNGRSSSHTRDSSFAVDFVITY